MPKSRNRRKNKQPRKPPAVRRKHRKSEVLPPPLRSIEPVLASQNPDLDSDSPQQQAQAIVYEAWEVPIAKDRVKLARIALAIWPGCADALVVLAEDSAQSIEEAVELYRDAVEAVEEALGEQCFKEDVGDFWGLLETRPYMRARAGLAQTLEAMGQPDEAIDHYRDMLRLNPGDNQGNRFCLLRLLIDIGRDEEAGRLLEDYSEDIMAEWKYGRALLLFRREGDSRASRDALSAALKANPNVPDYLLGRRKVPAETPAYIGLGDKREAQAYAAVYKSIWQRDEAALNWLKDQEKAGSP